jgi:heat-inducible transcriptional repressor
MADLEERGYLLQPHTSAGRVPTEQAMRYYVDSLINVRELDEAECDRIRNRYDNTDRSVEMILRRTSNILSAISRYAGLVASPRAEQIAFKHIEFIPLSRKRLLGIFVAQSGLVQNKIIECDHEFSYPELERINNYCNSTFLGLTLSEARNKVERELGTDRSQYDKLLKKAMTMSQSLLNDVRDGDLMVEGEELLMDTPEFSDIETLKEVMAALEEKQQIVKLLDRCTENEEVKIFIGAESGIPVEGVSIVTAPYRHGSKVIGTLGVIGPTRMNYSQIIPVVDFTAKLVSDLIEVED